MPNETSSATPFRADLRPMISWSKEYETGVASVDADHRRLAEGLNELEHALATGSGSKRVGEILAFLAEYAAGHFTREEACMNRFNCPTAAANKAAHREFIAKFTAAQARIEQSPGSAALIALQVHRELCDWIVNHILRVDSALRTCVPKVGAPAPRIAPRSL